MTQQLCLHLGPRYKGSGKAEKRGLLVLSVLLHLPKNFLSQGEMSGVEQADAPVLSLPSPCGGEGGSP